MRKKDSVEVGYEERKAKEWSVFSTTSGRNKYT